MKKIISLSLEYPIATSYFPKTSIYTPQLNKETLLPEIVISANIDDEAVEGYIQQYMISEDLMKPTVIMKKGNDINTISGTFEEVYCETKSLTFLTLTSEFLRRVVNKYIPEGRVADRTIILPVSFDISVLDKYISLELSSSEDYS